MTNVFAAAAIALVAGTSGAVSVPAVRARQAIDPMARMVHIAKARYGQEEHGAAVHKQLARIAADPAVIGALQSNDLTALRAAVASEQKTRGAHVSRLRVLRGSSLLADSGVVFVVAPAQRVVRDASGRSLGTLQVSIQDVIGYVRFMHRNVGVEVVARGRGPKHVRSSLPAALHTHLPGRGRVTISGVRYDVRSFTRHALNNEPVKIWILAKR